MTESERVLDHVEQGLSRMITQYRGKPLLAAWVGAYLRQVQLLEDAIYDVLLSRLIDRATGEALATLGRLVGELSEGRAESEYRVFIRARVRINRSRGNVDDVLAVLTLITATPVIFREYPPACLFFEMLVIPDHDPVTIYSRLRDAKAGGVKLTLIVPTSNTHALLPMTVGGTSNPVHAMGDANFPDATTFGLASDAVTMRDPHAPPSVPVYAPRLLYIDPPEVPE